MHAQTLAARRRRKGVVLVLILAMLGLLALIGVTFATFSGQAQVGAKYYQQALNNPDPEQYIDFALEQLINDSNNPSSAIRGHSLKRDMYGNDATNNIYMQTLPDPFATPLTFTNVTLQSFTNQGIAQSYPVVTTNIPANGNAAAMYAAPSLYGQLFTGCTMRVSQWYVSQAGSSAIVGPLYYPLQQVNSALAVPQTFEILADDNSGAFHVLKLSPYDTNGVLNAGLLTPSTGVNTSGTYPAINLFEIDGRFMQAFNGSGLESIPVQDNFDPGNPGVPVIRPYTTFPNFQYNGLTQSTTGTLGDYILGNTAIAGYPSGYNDPNNMLLYPTPLAVQNQQSFQMDEDYDAADNENMFLALQSADGQVVLPSFHRPGNIVYNPNNATAVNQNDWLNDTTGSASGFQSNIIKRAKFLRPRGKDHPLSGSAFPDLVPSTAGKITYDVDNDGDGVTDAVWVDLGYPPQRDSTGRLYKPMFAFTVLGLNGKLPINTAGNVDGRNTHPALQDPATPAPPLNIALQMTLGKPNGVHVSHLGYSPNEINPSFALAGNPSTGLTYLQLLLQGNPGAQAVTPPIPPVPGRFGEVEVMLATLNTANPGLMTFPRAGRTYHPSSPNGKIDGNDANYNGMDFFPVLNTSVTPPIYPESGSHYDINGSSLQPSERMRRAVTPWDITGNGKVISYSQAPNLTTNDFFFNRLADNSVGADTLGRVNYFMYFRPAGVPIEDYTAVPVTDISNSRLNRLHGYEAYRDPTAPSSANTLSYSPAPGVATTPVADSLADFVGKMPFNEITYTTPPMTAPIIIPTFDGNVNSSLITVAGVTQIAYDPTKQTAPPYYAQMYQGLYPGGSLALNESSQLNLYTPTTYDSPFGVADQEWLSRNGDIDDDILSNRLPTLIASGGTPKLDDLHRKMLSVESWDPISFAAANAANAPFSNDFLLPNPTIAYDSVNGVSVQGPVQPSLSHGNKRMNLNYPLPPSTSSHEPVRQKWVRDAYQMFKIVQFPPYFDINGVYHSPESQATVEQLAALGQFAVNIVDFRDPDDTMTAFLNYDLTEVAPGTYIDPNSSSMQAYYTPASVGPAIAASNTSPLIQYGMEYNPIAINEVLAYEYTSKDVAGNKLIQQQRIFIELINTLSQDGPVGNNTHCDQRLRGWGMIITKDDPTVPAAMPPPTYPIQERPNFITGQLSTTTINNNFVPLNGGGMGAGFLATNTSMPTSLSTAIPAQSAGDSNTSGLSPFVLVNALLAANTLPLPNLEWNWPPTTSPPATAVMPQNLLNQLPAQAPNTGTADSDYYWVHLLRPANPHQIAVPAGTTDESTVGPNISNEPKVVVDSFRFPYFVDNGHVANPTTANESLTPGTNAIYSARRLQPYRGGHYVPRSDLYDVNLTTYAANPATTPNYAPNPYGFSEQTTPPQGTTATTAMVQQMRPLTGPNQGGTGTPSVYPIVGVYNVKTTGPPAAQTPTQITGPIYSNIGTVSSTAPVPDNWDYLPFHDRDFQSVAELTLVPAVPPGLFTKLFVERHNPRPYFTNLPAAPAPQTFDLPPPSWASGSPPTPQTTPPTLWTPWYTPPPFTGLVPPTSNVYAVNGANTASYTTGTPGTLTPYQYHSGVRPTGDPVTFPYLSEGFHYQSGAANTSHPTNAAAPQYPPTGGTRNPSSGIGWYKFLEFFEVPTPVMGNLGPAGLGKNLDWQRQDLKPGLLNLNLIVDEEVFYGLIDDWRLNLAFQPGNVPAFYPAPDRTNPMAIPTNPNSDGQTITIPPVTGTVYPAVVGQQYADQANLYPVATGGNNGLVVGGANGPSGFGVPGLPVYATSIYPNGLPSTFAPVSDIGTFQTPGAYPQGRGFNAGGTFMKASFADFLKLRDGGSGVVFSPASAIAPIWGGGTDPTTKTTVLPRSLPSKPFRSGSQGMVSALAVNVQTPNGILPVASSAPVGPINLVGATNYSISAINPNSSGSLNDTVMRPARLAAISGDMGVQEVLNNYNADQNIPGYQPAATQPTIPGVVIHVPQIPPRKMFQIPDNDLTATQHDQAGEAPSPLWELTVNQAAVAPQYPQVSPLLDDHTFLTNQNADLFSAPIAAVTTQGAVTPAINAQLGVPMAHNYASLDNTGGPGATTTPMASPALTVPAQTPFLGSSVTGGSPADYRRHPYFRTEMLSKVMNLTTVRTHQYAVWLTVGFFQVVQPGNPQLFAKFDSTGMSMAVDRLGTELDADKGTNVRFRYYFLIDRTKASGFNPFNPGDFRDLVVFRRRIE